MEGLQAAALFGVLDFQDKMSPGLDAVDKKAKGFSASMSGVLKNVGQGFTELGGNLTTIAAPVAGFFGLAIKAASDSNNEIAQLNQVIKSTGGVAGVTKERAMALASSLESVTNFSKESVIQGESMLLTFTKIGSGIFPQASETALNMATKFGGVDQAAVQLGKALNDPVKGITALTRVGVTFTEQQKEQIKAFVAAGKLEDAQKVILGELNTEFGGLARSVVDSDGGLTQLGNNFHDLVVEIGNDLIPVIKQVIAWIRPFLQQIANWVQANPQLVGMIGMLALALGGLGPVLMVVGVALGAIGGLVGFVLSPIGLLVAAVAALALAFSTNFLGIRDLVGPILERIVAVLSTAGGYFQYFLDLFSQTGNIFTAAGSALSGFIGDLVKAITGSDTLAMNVGNGILRFFDGLEAGFNTAIAFIQGTIIPGIRGFIGILTQIWTDVSPYLGQLFNWFMNTALPAIGGAIQSFIDGFVKPITSILGDIWTLAQPFLQQLYDWFVTNGLPDIKQVLQFFGDNVLTPVINILSGIWDKVSGALTSFADWFHTNLPQIGNLFSQIGWGIGQSIQYIVDQIRGFLQGIIDFFQGAIDKFHEFQKTVTVDRSNLPGGQTFLEKLFPGFQNPLVRDSGGPGMAGQPYMIGSGAQPEMFVPKTNGTFIPNADQIGGNMNVTLIVTEGNARQAGYNFAGGLGDRMRAKGLTSG